MYEKLLMGYISTSFTLYYPNMMRKWSTSLSATSFLLIPLPHSNFYMGFLNIEAKLNIKQDQISYVRGLQVSYT